MDIQVVVYTFDQLGGLVDHGDIIMLTGQMSRDIKADLAGPAYDHLHDPVPTITLPEVLLRTRRHAQRFQFSMQRRSFHTDEFGSAGNITTKAAYLRYQVFPFENFPGIT